MNKCIFIWHQIEPHYGIIENSTVDNVLTIIISDHIAL